MVLSPHSCAIYNTFGVSHLPTIPAAMVVAGPGSGKTRVIVHRILHLVGPLQQPPGSILALTFTHKAAEEMKQRLSSMLPLSSESPHEASTQWREQPCVCTFHSFCLQILRSHGQLLGITPGFSVADRRCGLSLHSPPSLFLCSVTSPPSSSSS